MMRADECLSPTRAARRGRHGIEPRYRPYLVQMPVDPGTSKEAAAAAAAAAILGTIDDKTASEMKTALATYLNAIPDGSAKQDGVRLGEAVVPSEFEDE